ncbi:MAG: SAM-dependent methyltransferase [Leptospiraceae bacterium]|nr:MAG: SAM-dependent methyltransferase [Leptospiraceae bacterium]
MAVFHNQNVWDNYYKSKNKVLKYPDENLVRIIEKLNVNEWKRTLDFGCGTGRHLLYLKEKKIPELYGIDFSYEVIKNNQKRYPEIQFLFYEINTPLPFKDNYFDAIICWGVLHYNSEDIRNFLLKEFYRILKPDGFFIGTYRAKQDTHFKNSEIKDSEIYFFDENDIYKELNKYFKNIQLGYMERTPIGNLKQKIAHYFFSCKKNLIL